jgi:agmatinase
MGLPLTVPPTHGYTSFLYSTVVTDLDGLEADIAFLGIPHGDPYSMEDVNNDQSRAPTAVRQVTDRVVRSLERYDFDLGGPLYDGKDIEVIDCGDVPGNMHDFAEHASRAETVVRKILRAGAMPIVIGGDHAIPIPVLRAYDDQGPITLVQVDAHIDWREDVNGVRQGLSSPIRRASEMAHVG